MTRPLTEADRQDLGAKGAEVLATRLIDITPEVFGNQYWGKQALLARGVSDYSDLLSTAAVDELISQRGLRTPFLRVAKNGTTMPESSFTAPAGVGAGIGDQLDDTALWRQFADGATLVLQALHRSWPPIAALSSELGTELGHPVQANAYITPPQNRGFDAHYDVHDVFVLQVHGSKRWVIHEPVLPDPLRDQPWTDHRQQVAEAAAAAPAIDTVLHPGDALYLPRGWLHSAQAQGEVSIHLTLGLHVWTGYAVAEQLVRAALESLREDPEVRASLRLGVDAPGADASGVDASGVGASGFGASGDLDLIRERLLTAIAGADPDPEFRRNRRSQARPGPLGPLAQLDTLQHLDGETRLRLRSALAARMEGDRLTGRVGWLSLDPTEQRAAERLLHTGELTAGELGLEFAERLLRAGVVIAAGS